MATKLKVIEDVADAISAPEPPQFEIAPVRMGSLGFARFKVTALACARVRAHVGANFANFRCGDERLTLVVDLRGIRCAS